MDNDNCDCNGVYFWCKVGFNQLIQKVVLLKDGKKVVIVKVEILNVKGMKVGDVDFVYLLNFVGVLKVKVIFWFDIVVVKLMVCLGFIFEMNDMYGNVVYLGWGDNEIYFDCMQLGKIVLYQIMVECMFYYYVILQFIGNCMDVCWMKLMDEIGQGIFVDFNCFFQFSVIFFVDDVLEKVCYINDFECNGYVIVYLDVEQVGVGMVICGLGVQL